MRFNVGSLLLGLVALGSLPESSGRAIRNPSPGAVDLYKYESSHHVPRAVAPVRFGGGKVGGGKGDEITTGGGSGGKSTTGGDKDNDSDHVHIGADDGGDGKSSDSKDNTHIGDPDLYCRGTGCGGGSGDTTPEQKTLSDRGAKGIALVASPKKGDVDYSQRMKDNYSIKEEDFDEEAIRTVRNQGLDTSYGFGVEEDHWKTMGVRSNNGHENIVSMSVGRGEKDGKEYLALIAHERYADRDGNRYTLTESGDVIMKDDDTPVEQLDKDSKAVPVSQLVDEAAKESGKFTPAGEVDKIFLISENVVNPAATNAIDDALKDMSKLHPEQESLESYVFKKDATGVEGDHFKIIAGTDNNYSYLNTVGRNPDDFDKYDLVSIEVYRVPEHAMKIELSKKQSA